MVLPPFHWTGFLFVKYPPNQPSPAPNHKHASHAPAGGSDEQVVQLPGRADHVLVPLRHRVCGSFLLVLRRAGTWLGVFAWPGERRERERKITGVLFLPSVASDSVKGDWYEDYRRIRFYESAVGWSALFDGGQTETFDLEDCKPRQYYACFWPIYGVCVGSPHRLPEWLSLSVARQGLWAIGAVMLYCGAGFLGGSCAVALTKRFGALHSAITTTARKAVTLMLSFVYFKKALTPQHVIGATVFMIGLMVSYSENLLAGCDGTPVDTNDNDNDVR